MNAPKVVQRSNARAAVFGVNARAVVAAQRHGRRTWSSASRPVLCCPRAARSAGGNPLDRGDERHSPLGFFRRPPQHGPSVPRRSIAPTSPAGGLRSVPPQCLILTGVGEPMAQLISRARTGRSGV